MTNMTETSRTVTLTEFVREDSLVALAKRVAKINTQATKLGLAPVTCVATGREEERKVAVLDDGNHVGGQPIWITRRFVEFTVAGEQPILPGGWALVAVVDHREAAIIVNEVPGRNLPAGQRERGPICDHCDTIRKRAETFVLVDDDGTVTQVGRQCLGDFLGLTVNDPARTLLFCLTIGTLLAGFDDDADSGFGFKSSNRLELFGLVRLSGAIIEINGFVSRKRAESESLDATSGRALEFMFPPRRNGHFAADADATWRDSVRAKMTDDLDVEVADAIEWAKAEGSKPGASEFILNVGALATCGSVNRKYLGTAVWIIAGYRKAQQRLTEAAAKADLFATSGHVGEIKKRMEASLTLVDVRTLDGEYGTSYLTTFADEAGNAIKWFASSDPQSEGGAFGGWSKGEAKTVKMTPKRHGEYNGVLETMVNRVSPFAPKAPKAKKAK